MNGYWKKFWKDRYKTKSFNRTLKSMSKMEKYKYFAYPNHNYGALPLSGIPGYPPVPGVPGVVPPLAHGFPPITAPGFIPPYAS